MTLKSRKRNSLLFKWFCTLVSWSVVALLLVLIYHITKEGLSYLSWHFLTSLPSRFPEKAGILVGLVGTIFLMGLTALFAIPLAIFTAIYLEEYKIKGRIGNFIDLNVTNLAGIPSVVYGLLGLALFVRYFEMGRSILAGSMTLALLCAPVIIVSTREAIKAVPDSIRYAGYALGARKWQVVFFQVLPMSLPGILTGVILAFSRAIGEAAPLIIVGAMSYVSFVPTSLHDEFTTLPILIYNWASRPQEEFHQLAAAGITVLLLVMFSMNLIAIVIRQKNQKKGNS